MSEDYGIRFRKNYSPFLPKDRNSRILDVGCGDGKFLDWIRSEGYTDIHGCEVSDTRVSQARDRLEDQDMVSNEDGLSHLENCDDSEFGFILLHAVIEHLEKDYVERLLSTARRKLSENGVIVIMTGNLANPLSNSIMYGDFDHEFGYTPAGLSVLLEDQGYEVTAVSGFDHGKYNGTLRYALGQMMEAIPRFLLSLGYFMFRMRRPATVAPLMFVVATRGPDNS